MNYIRDVMFLLGLAALTSGTYFYDWRLALCVFGVSVMGVSIAGTIGINS